jgi:ABC-type glycerol-3-phosphate transport system permease component
MGKTVKILLERKTVGLFFIYLILIGFICIIDLPFVTMISASFKTRSEVLSSLSLLPEKISLSNYGYVIQRTDFMHNVGISVLIANIVTLTCVFVASMCGYAICRFRGAAFSTFSMLLLLLQMFPTMLTLIPLFLLFKQFRLIDNPLSLILSYSTFNLPFSIWLLNSYFKTIPYELEESAMIDGCGRFKIFIRIVMPVAMPGICTAGILTFINCWSEYTLASVFIRNQNYRTITLGLQQFILQYESNWAALMTAAAITTIPTIVFLLLAQKFLVQGMTAGALKG